MDFKRAQRELVVSGDKYNLRQRVANGLADLEPVEPRHLHIEKKKIWPELLDGRHGLPAIGAFAHDFKSRLSFQQMPDTGASRRLVIHDQRANGKFSFH